VFFGEFPKKKNLLDCKSNFVGLYMQPYKIEKQRGVSHPVALPFTLKSIIILRQKKNHGNSKKATELARFLFEYFII
jgi:hypothetical protein